jgi:hypothetical protein
MKTRRSLNLEYWGRCHDVCDEHNAKSEVKIKPQDCVKINGIVYSEYKQSDPNFNESPDNYEFFVGIVDDTPVFAGDAVYYKSDGTRFTARTELFNTSNQGEWTLTPPKPKRTFELNGKQLPCPIDDNFCDICDTYMLDIIGVNYYFKSIEDRNIVAKALLNLISDARVKE